jgi:hypothetical protein
MTKRYPLNFIDKITTYQINNDDNDENYNQYFDNCKKHYDTILEIFGNDYKINMIASLITDSHTMTHKNYSLYGFAFFVDKVLLLYAMKYNDTTILNMFLKNNVFGRWPQLFEIIFRHNHQKIFKIIFDDILWENISRDFLISNIAINKYDIYFLDMIHKTNYKMDSVNIASFIILNHIDALKYCMDNGYDIQVVCELFSSSLYSINYDMLKLLINYGVNMLCTLDSVFRGCISRNEIDTITFLIETYPEFNINNLVSICIDTNNINILKYLLQCGAELNTINNCKLTTINIKFETIKFIIQLGIELNQETLNQHMIKCFIMDDVLDNVLYLVEHGAEVDYIFKFDGLRETHVISNDDKLKIQEGDYKYVKSALEHMICLGKMNHLKYLIHNCYDLLMTEIDRLLILSICNGRYEMTKCFLEMGAIVDDVGFVCSCFFGHLNMVKLLLSIDIDIHAINDNFKYKLYDVLAYGFESRILKYGIDVYGNLIKDNNIFRNDIFQFGYDYVDIFKMLISLGVCIKECKVFLKYNRFYEIDIINCYVSNGGNPHDVLEDCIQFNKMDIIIMLLDMIDKVTIKDIYIDEFINKNDELKKLLEEHGYESQF